MILQANSMYIPLADESVNCVVTSPPYWGLRDYGVPGQIGLEPTPESYVEHIVQIFREVWRVLRKEATCWLNLGDCYATGAGKAGNSPGGGDQGEKLKPKDLVGIPWRVAFALRADGWWLRSDIVWSKRNCMPESVTDRPTRAHEYIFLLAKSERYYYDQDAIREPHTYGLGGDHHRNVDLSGQWQPPGQDAPHRGLHKPKVSRFQPRPGSLARPPEPGAFHPLGRNKRSVWEVNTQPFQGSHFATFPEKLIEPCILAGCPQWGIVLDPFGGSGTVGVVATRHRRRWITLDLSPEYCQMAKRRNGKEIQVCLM